MSQENTCECAKPVVMVPVRGLQLALDEEALGNINGGCDCPAGGGDGGIDYSFEEQWTGKRWVDGKKIYQKTIDCGALPNKAVKNVLHHIADIDDVVQTIAITSRSGLWAHLPSSNPSYLVNNVALNVSPTSVDISTGSNLSNYNKTFVTVQYTCTDR